MDLDGKFIIAHRGASALVAHENTLEAFEKAIEIGAQAMEFDVRLTRDKVIISYHDEYIEEGLKISNLTYNEIEEKANKKGFSVPTVEEILKISKNKIILDIELKETGYEEELIQLVTSYLGYEQFFMKSFLDESIIKIKEIDPNIRTGLLLGVNKPKNLILTRISELFPHYRILKAKPDFISPNYQVLKLGFINRMKLHKLPIFVWTVNDEVLMKKLLKSDITAIITDYPDFGLKVLNKERFNIK